MLSTRCKWLSGIQEFFWWSSTASEIETVQAHAPVFINFDFNGPAVDDTNDVNVTIVNFGAATADAGFAILTTGNADDDNVEVATEIVFAADQYAVCEARVRTDDAANQGFFFGFTDAITAGADLLPIDYSNAGALVTTASDAVGFVQDPDNGVVDDISLMIAAVANDVDTTPIDTGTNMVNGVLHTLRLELLDTGVVKYWVDGVSHWYYQ